jgi:hypothetical protein
MLQRQVFISWVERRYIVMYDGNTKNSSSILCFWVKFVPSSLPAPLRNLLIHSTNSTVYKADFNDEKAFTFSAKRPCVHIIAVLERHSF